MATFKAVVLLHQRKADKTVRIKIRVSHGLKTRYIDTGLIAEPSDLTRAGKLKSPQYINTTEELIGKYKDKCSRHYILVKAMTVDELVDFVITGKDKSDDLDFIAYGRAYITKLEKEGKHSSSSNYYSALNRLEIFLGRKTLHVNDITTAFLSKFQEWIINNPHNVNAKYTMRRAPSLYLGLLGTLHNAMKFDLNDEERGIVRIPYSPFVKLKTPKSPPTRKRAIPEAMVLKIASLANKKVISNKGTNRYNIAKDCFMLSFYLIGMNSADLYDVQEIGDTKLIYKRMKTRTQRADEALIELNIPDEAKYLIERYRDKTGKRAFNFYQHYSNFSIFNTAINKGLKVIGKELGLVDLEFYAARHTWASIALNRLDIDSYVVHCALNHVAEGAMKVTEIYIDKDFGPLNRANRKVIDFVMHSELNVA